MLKINQLQTKKSKLCQQLSSSSSTLKIDLEKYSSLELASMERTVKLYCFIKSPQNWIMTLMTLNFFRHYGYGLKSGGIPTFGPYTPQPWVSCDYTVVDEQKEVQLTSPRKSTSKFLYCALPSREESYRLIPFAEESSVPIEDKMSNPKGASLDRIINIYLK
ncbi:hypothetical protein Anas_09460 [Armadillidium nasatum]|uniref:Uncharacterized protein n=1 Tax=Armadillidium nasatum TaxID=96803 RepID=A0A5N5THG2_9CRUS|nr:hypothetical protein Anas_09460 [Armadillidium nasatum]